MLQARAILSFLPYQQLFAYLWIIQQRNDSILFTLSILSRGYLRMFHVKH